MTNRIQQFIGKDRETTMRPEFAFLCDHVDFTEKGLFNAQGAGIHEFHGRNLPYGKPVVLVMAIEYDPAEDGGMHAITIRIIDPDGCNKIKPITIDAEFATATRFYCLDTKLYPVFDSYGMHSVEIAIDSKALVSIPIELVRTD